MIAKYYTDIDVEEVAPQTVCDFLLSSPGAIRLIEKEAGEDFEFAKRMGERLIESCRVTYESEHGLAKRIKDLLNTDVDINNAETRELIEKLIDMKGALLEKEENDKILQFGKRKAAKTIKAGGAKINLAKKS